MISSPEVETLFVKAYSRESIYRAYREIDGYKPSEFSATSASLIVPNGYTAADVDGMAEAGAHTFVASRSTDALKALAAEH